MFFSTFLKTFNAEITENRRGVHGEAGFEEASNGNDGLRAFRALFPIK